jgi:two-component system sensor histidine kinase KdpD
MQRRLAFSTRQSGQYVRTVRRGDAESNVPGIGLGLAICRSIVKAHGGTIRASNNENGICVTFTLPLGEPPVIEPEDGDE